MCSTKIGKISGRTFRATATQQNLKHVNYSLELFLGQSVQSFQDWKEIWEDLQSDSNPTKLTARRSLATILKNGVGGGASTRSVLAKLREKRDVFSLVFSTEPIEASSIDDEWEIHSSRGTDAIVRKCVNNNKLIIYCFGSGDHYVDQDEKQPYTRDLSLMLDKDDTLLFCGLGDIALEEYKTVLEVDSYRYRYRYLLIDVKDFRLVGGLAKKGIMIVPCTSEVDSLCYLATKLWEMREGQRGE